MLALVAAVAVLSAVLLALIARAPLPVRAAGAYPGASAGYDISWPQCGGPYPSLSGEWFGIAGVNDGKPLTENPCLASELAWAQQNPAYAGLYVNVAYGLSMDGPLTCDPDDLYCQAYNYGWVSGQYAYVTALADTGGASEEVQNWWLDVEVVNTWSDNVGLNSAVIQGTLDYFEQTQGIQAGIYSVSTMWDGITAGFAPAGVPNWVAGGNDMFDFGTCGRPLWPGAQVEVFQSLSPDGQYDVDRGC
ncbi:MAG TPA: hypothetical protein VF137_01605 [Candidatus Dormibacteraeota bacterium]